MKNTTLLLIIMLLTMSCNAQQSGNLPDKKTMSLMQKADKTLGCHLNAMSNDFSKGNIIGIAAIDTTIEISQEQKSSLLSLIDETISNYNPEGATKMSAFIPEYAVQFVKAKDTITLLLDFHVDIMQFVYKNKYSKLYFDKTHDKILDFINGLYPKQDPKQDPKTDATKPDDAKLVESQPELLPEKLAEKIKSADSLEWYILNPFVQPSETDETFNGTLVLFTKDSKEAKLISDLLTSETSFVKTDLMKDCVFFPDLAIRMYAKGETVAEIVFSFSCNECKISSGEIKFQSDCSKIRKQIVEYSRKAFSYDRLIKVLSNQ